MDRWIVLSWLIGMTLLCGQAHGDKLCVVTTTTDLASIVSSVGGDLVDVKSICSGEEDPHFIQAKPSCISVARKADLWVRIGMELEVGWESPILDGSRNRKIRVGTEGHLDASEGILRLEVPTQKIDRSMGDVHPQGNPHYWLDPWNGRVVARSIRDRLARLDPAHSAEYQAHHEAFERRLDEAVFGKHLVEKISGEELWQWELSGRLEEGLKEKGLAEALNGWMGRLQPCQGARIVTYHRSWVYFAHRFDIEIVEELEPKPGIPPSPGHLADVIEKAQREGVKLLITEPFYDRKGADFVASKTGLTVVEIANSVAGQAEAMDYVTMLDNVVQSVAKVCMPSMR